MNYQEFLRNKVAIAKQTGFDVDAQDIHLLLKPHQRDIVQWAVAGGRRAIFAQFGLGKSFMQLEIARLVEAKTKKRFLIVVPLGVRLEFYRDAEKLGTQIKFVRSIEECEERGIYLTNYETVRDGKLDPRLFGGASLDEAAILRGLGGTKTFREFMKLFAGDDRSGVRGIEVPYRFVATATPSPNEYLELAAYADFLGILDVGQIKTRFFKRDSTQADNLTIHPHKEREFWLWCASWAIFLNKPSDLGYSDEGYELPKLNIHWHEIPSAAMDAGFASDGQGRLIRDSGLGITGASREKRESLPGRINKMMELRSIDPEAHRIIWHDLEAERAAIEKAIVDITTVYGSQNMEEREQAIIDFSDGKVSELAGKPVMLGSGCNFQRHCAWAIYLGIGFKFNEFIQSVHRLHRFLQEKEVRIDLIYTDAERSVRDVLERKWENHKTLVDNMSAIIKEYGLAQASIASALGRKTGVERVEVSGTGWKVVNNDCVLETQNMLADSVHFILTSVPFSTQYEYTPNYCDFGHTDSNEHFWQQMDYLIPQLYRTLKPGRVAAIHVKDRIVPGGINGLGFQTVYAFSDDTRIHFEKHGFGYLGRITIVTDVVRENNQTYRLGWTEQCKDGTKMGRGLPEYLMLFRKPPTDNSNGYADEPAVKNKGEYSRSRWQIDAHGFHRSNGNRLLQPEELKHLKHDQIFKLFRDYSLKNVYDFEFHVKLGEELERMQRLPVTFMLLQPASWHPDVWSDVTRMLTLNTIASQGRKLMHLCPMQFDIADRAITCFTMPGETVLDPFGGLMTVPYRALLLGRKAIGIELSPDYFYDGSYYCQSAEKKMSMPSLFDLEEAEVQAS